MTKIKIKDNQFFKKVVGLSASLTNKSRPDSVEGCIFFKLKDGVLTLTSGCSGSHLSSLSIEVESLDEDSFSVQSNLILELVKNLPNKEVTINKTDDVLSLCVASLGTQSIPLHNSGNLSNELTSLNTEISCYQIQGSSTLSRGLKSISNFISKERCLQISSNEDYVSVIGLGNLGYISYVDYGTCKDKTTFYLDSFYLPFIYQLGEVISIGVNEKTIEINSDIGSIYLYNPGSISDEYESVKKILELKKIHPSITLPLSELKSAIQWRTIKLSDLEPIELSINENGYLSLGGDSSIPLSSKTNEIRKVSVNNRALQKAVDVINSEEVSIDQREINIDDEVLIITCFSTHGYKGSSTCSLVFEQA